MKVKQLIEGEHTPEKNPDEKLISTIDPITSSVVLIQKEREGEHNIIVDTGAPGMADEILKRLSEEGVSPEEVEYVINTHEHFDHCSNNNLFPNATQIINILAWTPPKRVDVFRSLKDINIQEGITIISTPGHKDPHCSVIVKADKVYAIAGDTIQPDFYLGHYEGIEKLASAETLMDVADVIIPGHGKMMEKEDFDHVRKRIKDIRSSQRHL